MTLKSFKKEHPMFFYTTIILSIVLVLMVALVVAPARCKTVELEEAIPYTVEEEYLTTEEIDAPLKYGAYYWVLPAYYNWTHYTHVKVYVKNIDEKTGYFTVHVNISNSTDVSYDNETHAIEPNQEVVFWFEYEEGEKDQNVTAEYWVDPGTYKKTVTHTITRTVTKYRTEKTQRIVCI